MARHPDQAVFEACDHWHACHADTQAAWGTKPEADVAVEKAENKEGEALEAVADTVATTPEGLLAKAHVIFEDHFNDLLDDQCTSERLLKSVILELISVHGDPQQDRARRIPKRNQEGIAA